MYRKLLSIINYNFNIDNILRSGKCLKSRIMASITKLYIFPVHEGAKKENRKEFEKKYRNGIFALLRFQFEKKK